MNVKSAFLNGYLKEKIYVDQPMSYKIKGHEENNQSIITEFKNVMAQKFEMTDIGLMAYYLGIEVKQMEDCIFISQAEFMKEILKKFNMEDCKLVCTPIKCGTKLPKNDEGEKVDPALFKSLIGSLRYLACIRPNILFGVGLVSRYI
ncbi:uncharacterized protein LOC111372849 [Olea europaea var. sylvestris]|uniref:uncharacterized protein LOC111372849 n=1 Tax=Olea europaea var. sylvestris TaxID=158386 RepID=UPI000C1D88CE|nr:uncharacterized protein LOC111372849 [Olea europaea var. sylvestris]